LNRRLEWISDIEKKAEGIEIEKQENKILPKEGYLPEGDRTLAVQRRSSLNEALYRTLCGVHITIRPY
jgi:hypothetical protein